MTTARLPPPTPVISKTAGMPAVSISIGPPHEDDPSTIDHGTGGGTGGGMASGEVAAPSRM